MDGKQIQLCIHYVCMCEHIHVYMGGQVRFPVYEQVHGVKEQSQAPFLKLYPLFFETGSLISLEFAK